MTLASNLLIDYVLRKLQLVETTFSQSFHIVPSFVRQWRILRLSFIKVSSVWPLTFQRQVF